MAERRMLAKSIIESDFFSDMPVESQMLYIRLNMMADDDGFVSNPRAIMRMYGFADDSMRLLMSKNFVLEFKKGDNFVYLIKHWKIHNYIQKDRYKRSAFQELLRDVFLDENKAYSMNPGEGHKPALPSVDTNCIHDVHELDTQDRLGKDSIEQFSVDQDSTGKGVQGENPEPTIPDTQESSTEKNNYSVISSCIPEERKKYWKDRIIKAKTLYPAMIPGLIRIAVDEGIIINEEGEITEK